MNGDDHAAYIWLWGQRKRWTEYPIRHGRERRYDRFMRKLYIPTRALCFAPTRVGNADWKRRAKPLTVCLLTSSSARKGKWVRLISARKGWKIANSFSPGWYR